MTDYELRMWRASLARAPDTLLRTEEAVQALPLPADEARAWLSEQQPTTGLEGVFRWGDLQASILDTPPVRWPIITWTEAARAKRMSVHRLHRLRKKRRDTREPNFSCIEELDAYLEGLRRGRGTRPVDTPAKPKRPSRKKPGRNGPLDLHAVGRTKAEP